MVKVIFLVYNVILIMLCSCAYGLYTKIQEISYKSEWARCRFDQESCNNGVCVDDSLFCDGNVECEDGSDETQECKRFKCPRYLYTCKYGACINSDKVCDNKIDCADGSDEENCIPSMAPIFVTCEKNLFRCNNGDCVPDTDICDGVAHCGDGSDETFEVCKELKCWPFLFQCDYGACINEQKRCNGIANCVDNSDEANCSSVISYETPTEPTYNIITTTEENDNRENWGDCCRLPEHPENGKWNFLSGITAYTPGLVLCGTTTIVARCNQGYKMYPDEYAHRSMCQDQYQQMPKCLKTCRSMENRFGVMSVKCDLDGSEVTCKNPNENTRVTITYTPIFGDYSITTQQKLFCVDGLWKDSQKLPTITNIYSSNRDAQGQFRVPTEILTYYLLNNRTNTPTFIIFSDEDNLYPIIK